MPDDRVNFCFCENWKTKCNIREHIATFTVIVAKHYFAQSIRLQHSSYISISFQIRHIVFWIWKGFILLLTETQLAATNVDLKLSFSYVQRDYHTKKTVKVRGVAASHRDFTFKVVYFITTMEMINWQCHTTIPSLSFLDISISRFKMQTVHK